MVLSQSVGSIALGYIYNDSVLSSKELRELRELVISKMILNLIKSSFQELGKPQIDWLEGICS